jgi:hypothetical protein
MVLWQHLQDTRMEAAEWKAAFQETKVRAQAVAGRLLLLRLQMQR